MDDAPVSSSQFTSSRLGVPARSNYDQGEGSSTCNAGQVEQAEQAGPHPGLPVHVVIDIPAHGDVNFGMNPVDSALLATRGPSPNPGTVVQLTVTSSRLPGVNHEV